MAASRNILSTRFGRFATFGALYIAEGVPLGFTATLMAAYMRREGLDVSQVGAFVGILYLPWAFKWAWAPLIDIFPLHRWGGRRTWITGSLLMMILTLIVVGLIDFTQHFELVLALIFMHNVFAATQDVAIDALAISALRENERGTGNGVMFGGAYLGQGLGGGGALFIAGMFGFEAALLYACVLMAAVMIFAQLFVVDPATQVVTDPGKDPVMRQVIGAVTHTAHELFNSMFRSGKGPIVGVLFALTPMGATALNNAVASTLQVDFGLNDTDIAQISLYSTVLAAVGCVAGGMLGDRFGLRRMIGFFYVLSAFPGIYLALRWGENSALPSVSKTEFFTVLLMAGMATGFYYGIRSGVFMGLTNPAVAATQFTGFMALSNLTISYTNNWQGFVAQEMGYSAVLWIDAALVLVPLMLLPFMTPRKPTDRIAPSAGAPLPEAS